MNADDLRAVAKEIREKANAATPGPYIARPTGGGGHWIEQQAEDANDAMTQHFVLGAYNADRYDVEYMMAWHPAVALAVADWLDAEAKWIDAGRLSFRFGGVVAHGASDAAIAFVKAWRGES